MEGSSEQIFPEDHNVQAFKLPVAESHILLPFAVVISRVHPRRLPALTSVPKVEKRAANGLAYIILSTRVLLLKLDS